MPNEREENLNIEQSAEMNEIINAAISHLSGVPSDEVRAVGLTADVLEIPVQEVETIQHEVTTAETSGEIVESIQNEDQESFPCRHCGVIHSRANLYLRDGHLYCRECRVELFRCASCGVVFHSSHAVVNHSHSYCPDCGQHFVECTQCGESFSQSAGETINGDFYCMDCFENNFTRCSDCGDAVPNNRRDEMFTTENGLVCESCYDRNYGNCEECGGTFHNDNLIYNNNNDCNYCNNCNNRRSRVIHDYSYKPSPEFFGKGNLHFGIELEVEKKSKCSESCEDIAQSLLDQFSNGLIYIKHDGSLSNGFEVVTHPMTFEWIQSKDGEKSINKIMDLKNDCASWRTSTCGMHIHMSRKAFTTLHLYKFLKFFYECSTFCFRVSHRRNIKELRHWARFDTSRDAIIYKAKNKESADSSRYEAVNLCSRNTVEIRIFKGTLNKNNFLKNIQFCHAVYTFSKDTAVTNINSNAFKHFISDKKEYVELKQFIADKGI